MSAAALVRARAATAVAAVRAGRSLDAVLPEALAGLPPRDAGLCRELASGTIRYCFSLDHAVCRRLRKPLQPADQDVHALLLVGLYQLRHLRVPDHAALHSTADAARTLGKAWAVGLVNGVLRSLSRQQPGKGELAAGSVPPEVVCDHPAWLLGLLQQAWPKHWSALVRTNQGRAPMVLRCRPGSRDSTLAALAADGIEATATILAEHGLQLQAPVPVAAIPGHNGPDAQVSVQDEGAQLAAAMLAALAPQGGTVLDACAAPGGKTAALLERRPDLQVTAIDHDPDRITLVQENLQRLGLTATVLAGDGRQPEAWWPGGTADAVLLDAPCTGTGTLRRHPDIKLLRRAEDVPAMALLQAALLRALWPLLSPGGALVYCTCSVLPQENDAVLEAFLADHPDACARPADAVAALAGPGLTAALGGDGVQATRHGLQLLPTPDGPDGFYYAVLDRRP